MELLEDADLIVVAAHSQGSIVSVLLLSQLIQRVVNTRKTRVVLLSLAGILHGPHLSLKSSIVVQYVETLAARELFHFCNLDSADVQVVK